MIIVDKLFLYVPNLTPRKNDEGPMILACSAVMSREHQTLFYTSSRSMCADRQGVFDHLYPKRLLKSTLKVSITQGAHVFSKYMTDQIKEDMERDEKVAKGIMTREQAEEESERWQQIEWNYRFQELPRKLIIALSKYHAIILTMRLYEWIASKWVDQEMMDRLTIDTFLYAKRKSEVEGKRGTELAREMFSVSWRANLISFLADYSVHQVIMLYAYYCYAQQKRRKSEDDSVVSMQSNDDMPQGHLILFAVRKSTLLGLSRGIALGFSSIGAGLGSMIAPSWGTLIGTNLGDGLAASLTEDLVDHP